MGKNANTILTIARGYLGCKESNGSHKQIIDVYNSHKPLARSYKVKYTDSWCATFVSACAIKANYTDIIPTECSCNQMIKRFQSMGRWTEDDGHVPHLGDIIFYDWQDNGRGDNKGSSDHVGIVEKVANGKITVIEGNKSDAVARRVLNVNGRYIRGFGCPAYDNTTHVTTPAVQNNASNASNQLGTYVVTASALKVREGAGTNYMRPAVMLCFLILTGTLLPNAWRLQIRAIHRLTGNMRISTRPIVCALLKLCFLVYAIQQQQCAFSTKLVQTPTEQES